MTRSLRFAIVASVALLIACQEKSDKATTTTVAATDSSLYKRLGGYDAIAAVTDDFLHRIHSDTTVMAFFAGLDSSAMAHIRQMVVDQLCAATGGPCIYIGKSMKDAHAQLDITPAAFDAFAGHFKETLVAFKVGDREQNEVMGALASMKADVVKP